MKLSANWRSWRSCHRANERRAWTKLRRVILMLTLNQKNFLHRHRVEFKATATRDDIRIVPAQFRDAVFGCERRHFGRSANLPAACNGNHNGRLLLTFLRRLNGETTAAGDDGKDVQEVD